MPAPDKIEVAHRRTDGGSQGLALIGGCLLQVCFHVHTDDFTKKIKLQQALFILLVIYHYDKFRDDARMTREEIRRENARKLASGKGGKSDFARLLGMDPSQVSQIIGPSAKKNIGNSIARRIEVAYKLPENWIDSPHPELRMRDDSEESAANEPIPISGNVVDISQHIERARADAILAGDPSYQPVLATSEDEGDVAIPLVELRLSAGVSGFAVDQDGEGPKGYIKVDRRFVTSNMYDPAKLFALHVRGDSMEPKLSDGDTVIINTADIKPVDGVVYAVNYEGEAVIKRLARDAGDWWLMSDNPDQRKYHRKVCRGAGCIIVGRAIQAITKL